MENMLKSRETGLNAQRRSSSGVLLVKTAAMRCQTVGVPLGDTLQLY